MTVTEKTDLTDKAFLASLPRPTGGELVPDQENSAIHGVALIGPQSRNDGAKFSIDALRDFERIINSSPDPITVQFGHFQKPTFDENGGIVNAYLDGNVLRGSHFLNPFDTERTNRLIYNAAHFKSNQCYSVEVYENDLVYKDTGSGRSIVGAKGIKWFAVDRSCGTTDGMNKSLVREEKHKMPTKPVRPEQIERRYPHIYKQIVDKTRAEALAEVTDQVVSEGALATLESKIEELQTSLSERQSEVDRLIAENEQRIRRDEVRQQWAELIKDVNLDLLPDTEEGKIIRALGELTDEEIADLATGDSEKSLRIRLATIKNNLVMAETYKEKKSASFVDVSTDKKPVASGIDLGGIQFGGFN